MTDLASLVIERTAANATSTANNAIPTRFAEIDQIVGGLSVGLTVLAGAPAIGSSCLASQIALAAATDPTTSVAILPTSGGAGELICRLRRTLAPGSDGAERLWPDPLGHALEIPPGRIWVDTGVAHTIDEVDHTMRDWSRTTPATQRLVVVDGLHGIAGVDLRPRRGDRAAERLRRVAKEVNAAVLLTAQLQPRSRQSGWRPKLSELRAYGSVLDHSDLVILIHRDDYYTGAASDRHSDAELTLWSPQSGSHQVSLCWSRSLLRFTDYDH